MMRVKCNDAPVLRELAAVLLEVVDKFVEVVVHGDARPGGGQLSEASSPGGALALALLAAWGES